MRALALTALWAGRLVDGVRRGALSTGVTARSRVLQNLAAVVSCLMALDSSWRFAHSGVCLVELNSSFRSPQFKDGI